MRCSELGRAGEGLIRHLGVTNFDSDHLRLLVKDGIRVATNQVCFSLLDRRAAEDMTAFCRARGSAARLRHARRRSHVERWLGRPEPASEIADWSTMKYKRFVDAIGGWGAADDPPRARRIAAKHGVSIANVATRWVLDQPAVAAVIVGARLGEREHRDDNRRLLLRARRRDRAPIDAALAATNRSPATAAANTAARPISPRRAISATISNSCQGLCSRASRGRPGGCALDPAAPWSRSAATAARSGSASACW